MSQTWSTIKGYVMGGIALIACPCHLPITLPILVALTAGTAFSVWLSNNFIAIAGILTVIFVGALVLSFRWIGKPASMLPVKRSAPAQQVVLVTSRRGEDCD
jgi:mercuric ion transport protein